MITSELKQPPLQLNAITLNSNADSLRIPIKIILKGKPVTLTALLDTGAQENFINFETAQRLGIRTRPLDRKIIVTNADGTPNIKGTITDKCLLKLRQPRLLSQHFYLTHLANDDIILGMPWFKLANPQIQWGAQTITINRIKFNVRKRRQPKPQLLITAPPKPRHVENVPDELQDYADVFSDDIQAYPPARKYDHEIRLKPSFVHQQPPEYRLSPNQKQILKEYLDEWKAKKFIEAMDVELCSHFAPFFFVNKKDSKEMRPIMDYRYLNEHSYRDGFPIPSAQELLDQIHGSRYFTTLDVRHGYNNIRIKEEDQWKAAFRTPFGVFKPRVMFFGLSNSPATFVKFMRGILGQQILDRKVVVYMDDLLIHAPDIPTLIQHEREILEIFRQEKLYCKPSKCHFHKTEVEFLGHTISQNHIHMTDDKLQGISQWPIPRNIKDVRQFTGFCNFYRRFIPHFATLCRPIDQLKRKNIPFIWGKAQDAAFQKLKQIFTSKPFL